MPLELILRNYIITSGLAARPNPSVKRRSNGGQFPIRRHRRALIPPVETYPFENYPRLSLAFPIVRNLISHRIKKKVQFSINTFTR